MIVQPVGPRGDSSVLGEAVRLSGWPTLPRVMSRIRVRSADHTAAFEGVRRRSTAVGTQRFAEYVSEVPWHVWGPQVWLIRTPIIKHKSYNKMSLCSSASERLKQPYLASILVFVHFGGGFVEMAEDVCKTWGSGRFTQLDSLTWKWMAWSGTLSSPNRLSLFIGFFRFSNLMRRRPV